MRLRELCKDGAKLRKVASVRGGEKTVCDTCGCTPCGCGRDIVDGVCEGCGKPAKDCECEET